MAKIIGNTVGTPNPRPDWNQTDSKKADYIKNKPTDLVSKSYVDEELGKKQDKLTITNDVQEGNNNPVTSGGVHSAIQSITGGTGLVNSVNGKIGEVTLSALDIGALPDTTIIPSKISELDNDKNFVDQTELEAGLAECQKPFIVTATADLIHVVLMNISHTFAEIAEAYNRGDRIFLEVDISTLIPNEKILVNLTGVSPSTFVFDQVIYAEQCVLMKGYICSDDTTKLALYPLVTGEQLKVHFPFKGYSTGDCTIIETKNSVIMIDCGEKVENVRGSKSSIDVLIEYMVANKLTKIDYFIVSHFHSDHLGGKSSSIPYGLQELFADSRINTDKTQFILPHKEINYSSFFNYSGSTTPTAQTLETRVKELCTGARTYHYPEDNEELIVDDCVLSFHNIGEKYYNSYYNEKVDMMNSTATKTIYNNFSMVVQLSHGDNRFLFTGDIEPKAQELLADVIKNPDVVKIEHHGLNYTSHNDYLKVIAPKYAVIMEYDEQIDGYTVQRETFNKARLTGTVFSSNLNGNIVIISKNNTLCAITENGNANELHFRTLDSGEGLVYGEDLNVRTEVGEFYSWGTNLTSTLINCPITEGGFKLIVECLSPGNQKGVTHTLITDDSGDGVAVYSRVQNGYNSNEWSPWHKFDTNANLYKRKITSEEDLNDITEPGVYYYVTAGLPANAPFDNASIIEVIKTDATNNRIIQRGTRYGSAGATAFRILYSGTWLSWRYPLVTAANDNSTVADYVVEEGASGKKWTYRKWKSGVVEAWGTVTITLTNDAYEIVPGLHCCAGRGTLPTDTNGASIFTSVKCVSLDPIYSYQMGASGRVKSDMTFECNMFGLSANLSTMTKDGQYDINCIIKGNWK